MSETDNPDPNAGTQEQQDPQPTKSTGRFKPQQAKPATAYPAVGPGNEPGAPLDPEDAQDEDGATVDMIFTKEVTLTLDDHRRVRFPVGKVEVPASLKDHWYLKAHGAKLANSVRASKPSTDGA